MTVLDAYAVIAYFRDEPARPRVQRLLRTGTAALTAVGLAEVVDHLVRLVGADEDAVVLDLAEIGLFDAIDVDSDIGAAAGRLRARHYHRTRCPVSMADCVAAETARWHRRPLATADPDLLTVCERDDIPKIPLPASDGTQWRPPRGTVR